MPERDRNLEAVAHNIRAFEEALEAGATTLPEVRCPRILAAADGSNQVDALGRVLSELLACDLCVEEVGAVGDGADRVLAALPAGVRARALRLPRALKAEDGHRVVLEVAREHHADLVALPVPFLADYADVARESLGVIVDVLLERMQLPLLAVRDPAEREGPRRTVLFVEASDAASLRAAAWALAASRGPLSVVVAASGIEHERWQHLVGQRFAPDDEVVREALSLGTAPLVGAVHRAARTREREARVRVAVEPIEQVIRAKNEVPGLHVVAQGPLCRPVLLASENPVLAVP
jgi:hypothetical protein